MIWVHQEFPVVYREGDEPWNQKFYIGFLGFRCYPQHSSIRVLVYPYAFLLGAILLLWKKLSSWWYVPFPEIWWYFPRNPVQRHRYEGREWGYSYDSPKYLLVFKVKKICSFNAVTCQVDILKWFLILKIAVIIQISVFFSLKKFLVFHFL